jgi:hypothetical protein
MLIKNVFIKKCSYYYEFEKLLRNSLIITSSIVMKSTRFDTNDSKNFFQEWRKEEWKKEKCEEKNWKNEHKYARNEHK